MRPSSSRAPAAAGRAAAERFAAEGASLVLGDRDEAGLDAAAHTLRALSHRVEILAGDVAEEDTAAALVRRAIEASAASTSP